MLKEFKKDTITSSSIIYCISHMAIVLTIFSSYTIINYSTIGIGFAVLSILLNINKINIKPRELFALMMFTTYCILVFSKTTAYYHILQNMRYWFGVLIYILFFNTLNNTKFVSVTFFRIMCLSVLLEAILINLVIDSSLLHGTCCGAKINIYFADGLYERPIGFTGNPGTSGVFLIILLYYISNFNNKRPNITELIFLIITILSLVSTTALVILLLYLFIISCNSQHIKLNAFRLSCYYFFMLIPIITILINVEKSYIQKFSMDYIIEIYNAKIILLSKTHYNILGDQINVAIPATSGDFGLLILFTNMGIFGFITYFTIIFMFNRFQSKNYVLVLLFIIGSTHYPAMFQPAGQVLTAMVLMLNAKSINYKKTTSYNHI